MPRDARIVAPNFPHHVTQRGNYNQKIFYTNKNYEVETDKTRASYILEKGNLIARESEVKRFSTFRKIFS